MTSLLLLLLLLLLLFNVSPHAIIFLHLYAYISKFRTHDHWTSLFVFITLPTRGLLFIMCVQFLFFYFYFKENFPRCDPLKVIYTHSIQTCGRGHVTSFHLFIFISFFLIYFIVTFYYCDTKLYINKYTFSKTPTINHVHLCNSLMFHSIMFL